MNKQLTYAASTPPALPAPGLLLGMMLAIALPCSATAGPGGSILITNIGTTEVELTTPEGTRQIRRVPVEKAPPGAVVLYTTTFLNQGTKSAADIAITNPIPAHTSLVADSAFGENTVITYSIDGGKSFAAPEKLRVKNADGVERPARAAEYTHVRWAYQGTLAPSKVGSVGFRVIVN